MESNENAGRVIQSVQRAFDLLERVATKPNGARLSELADGAGLNRSTTHNLLASMEALGYIAQDGKGAPYRLTGRLGHLLRPSVEAELALRARMRPVLEDIAAQTGETVYLAFASGEQYLCADAVQSDAPLRLTVLPGEREPLLGTAIGHALLADDPDLADIVGARHPDVWREYQEAIDNAREAGHALDTDGFQRGVSCAAVPLGNGAAIGVAGPTSRLPMAQLLDISDVIRERVASVR